MKNLLFNKIKVLLLIAFNLKSGISLDVTSNPNAVITDQSLNNWTETPTLLKLSADVNQIDKNNTIFAIDLNESIGQTTQSTTIINENTEIENKFNESETNSSTIEGFGSTESVFKDLSEDAIGSNQTYIGSTDSSLISPIVENIESISANIVTETRITDTSTSKSDEITTKNAELIESTDLDNNLNISVIGSLNPETITSSELSETTIASTLISTQDNSNESNYRFIESESVLQTITSLSNDSKAITETVSEATTSEATTHSTSKTILESITETNSQTVSQTSDSISSIINFESNRTKPKITPQSSAQISTKSIHSIESNNGLTEKTLNNEKTIESLDPMLTTSQTFTDTSVAVETGDTVESSDAYNISNTETVTKRSHFERTTTPMEVINHSIGVLNLKHIINETIVSANISTTTTSPAEQTRGEAERQSQRQHKPQTQPQPQPQRHSLSVFKVMCTVGGWAAHRPGLGRFELADLERESFVLSRCSHLIYSYVSLSSNGRVVGLDPIRELNPKSGTFAKLLALKKRYPHLKTLIAVGGWDTPANVLSFLVSDSNKRQTVAQRVTQFVKQYSFDGAVISWFYPGAKWRSGQSSDKNNLVLFLEELKSKLDLDNLELGLMAPALQEDIDSGFDVPNVSKLVDHLLLMTYDYFGSWDQTVNHFAPLYAINNNTNKLNVDFTLNYWLSKGAIREKTVLGLATYGRSFTLADPQHNKPNALAIGPGITGPYTNRPGIIGFNEICEIFLSTAGVQLEEDSHKVTPFIHLYDQWVGFEDELSLFMKTQYAITEGLEGVFFWTLDLDDFNNKCGWGHFPLLRASLQAIYKTKDIQ